WIEDHHEAYVSSREWAEMQRRLTNNRSSARPPLGRRQAQLQGFLRFRVHNVTLGTFYPYRDYRAAGEIGRAGCYRCDAGGRTGVNGSCGRILAALVDQAVVSELLKTVVPPSLDDVRDAAREALRTHEALIRARQDELRRADQSVAEAERAFDQVDDGHPYLKARLAERLDETLRQRGQLRERHLLTPLTPPLALDANALAELAHLIEDLPRLWRDP